MSINKFILPEISNKLKCKVEKVDYFQAILSITKIEGFDPLTNYKAILKTNSFDEYLCDKIKIGDEIDCFLVSYSDSGIIVAMN